MTFIKTLSVIIPLYNESGSIQTVLERVCSVTLTGQIRKEVIVVNDCSTDDSGLQVQAFIRDHPAENIQYTEQPVNRGKGAAIHKGIAMATGEYLVVQDADLEYDPAAFNQLLEPVLAGKADVVYGSRFKAESGYSASFRGHRFGNWLLTAFSNFINRLSLTDMETCYKLMSTKLIRAISLKEQGFGFEPEITAKLAKLPGIRITEVSIPYQGRSYREGKKIGWKDGFRAIYCILRYGLFK